MISKIKREYVKIIGIAIILIMCIYSNDINTGKIFPSIDLMFVYYWCLFKPKTTGSIYVFLLGLFKDVLMGFPIGLNASIFIIIRLIAKYRINRLRLSFILYWQGFALLLAVTLLFKWAVFSLITSSNIDVNVVFEHFMISILTYPMIHGLFNQIFHITLPPKANA